jgi:hypothetical protein
MILNLEKLLFRIKYQIVSIASNSIIFGKNSAQKLENMRIYFVLRAHQAILMHKLSEHTFLYIALKIILVAPLIPIFCDFKGNLGRRASGLSAAGLVLLQTRVWISVFAQKVASHADSPRRRSGCCHGHGHVDCRL